MAEATPTYRFGEFHLDPVNRKLQRGDEDLTLPLKVFNCLVYLVEHHDRAVSRDELIAQVWGTVNMTDNTLAQAIVHARHALGDSGEDQKYIETVRGFGYRWAAPVQVEEPAVGEPEPPPAIAPAARRRPTWLWILLALLALGALAAAIVYLWRSPGRGTPGAKAPYAAEGDIALLLPVSVEAGPSHDWIRLGAMELIAGRLRAAGQAMVPSDTVISLLRGVPPEPGSDELADLTTATGAHLVLGARAEADGAGWRVSLRPLHAPQPLPAAVGEAEDVLAAAALAADRMVLYLGLTPAPEPDGQPGLQTLLHQIEAARLAQRHDQAQELLDAARPELLRHPEVRFQQARLDYYSHRLEAARDAFASIVEETPAARDPVLRARALNGLAAVHTVQGDYDTAQALMEEALHLLRRQEPLAILGTLWMNLGNVAQARGDLDAARGHAAQARRIFEAIGAVPSLATLELNAGVLEARRERYADALHHFEAAAERHAAVQNVAGELSARAYAMAAHLLLLDLPAASALESRVNELLAQTTVPARTIEANLVRVDLLDAGGRHQAAGALLDEALAATEDREAGEDLHRQRIFALSRLAEHATRDGDAALAVRSARQVVEGLAADPAGIRDDARGRAWLILVRASLARGDFAVAVSSSAALSEWANQTGTDSPKISAALAEAELSAAQGRPEAAEAAYERALALADDSQVPIYVLRVARAYVPWLLADGPDVTPNPERALRVADRVNAYTGLCYDAALIQLRVYQALGPASAWRMARARADSLAGERQIPAALQVAP